MTLASRQKINFLWFNIFQYCNECNVIIQKHRQHYCSHMLFTIKERELIVFNVVKQTLTKITIDDPHFKASTNFSSIGVGKSIYAIGGYCGNEYLNQCVSIDAAQLEIIEHESMSERKYCIGLASHNKALYVIGGYNGKTLQTCEQYSIPKQKWSKIASLNEKRASSGVCILAYKFIFAISGYMDGKYLDSVERYYIAANEWTLINISKTSVWEPYYACGASTLSSINNEILIFGGYKGKKYLCDCFKLTISNCQHNLFEASPLAGETYFVNVPSPMSYKDYLFAVDYQHQVHIYDFKYKSWKMEARVELVAEKLFNVKEITQLTIPKSTVKVEPKNLNVKKIEKRKTKEKSKPKLKGKKCISS